MDVHFSSNTYEWETPQDLFDELNSEFGFTLDVCATFDNAKCPNFYSPIQDGLLQEWKGICWMNPPYGKQIKEWMKKAYWVSLKGVTVVCLVPSRTDSGWWHDYAMKGEIRFIRGRLRFGGSKNSAPFPSAIIVFRPREIDGVQFIPDQMGLFRSMGES
jgi:phage N-6-adenine-methyltransferase